MSKSKVGKRKIIRRIIIIPSAAILLLCVLIIGMCLFNQRPAVEAVEAYQSLYSDTAINVSDDGSAQILPVNSAKNKKTGIIFYVGAQITPDAYIPLLSRITEKGYSCFIPKLACNMAALEPGAAEKIIASHPEIKTWFIAGHSMGGLTASGFADDHREKVNGLILIAAYTNRDMSDIDLPVLSVYGDCDGVMNKKLYDERLLWNTENFEEHIIAGANHAQYGDYGVQPRDNEAKITAEEQQTQTADIIIDWLERQKILA